MAKLPSGTYRPDLPTFGYTEKSLCNGKEPTARRTRKVWYGVGCADKPLGWSHLSDSHLWAEWHQGIHNAPYAPDEPTITRQALVQRQNETGIFPGWEDVEVTTPALDPIVFLKWDGEVWGKLGHFMHLEAA